ncbi:MAG: NAD-dependent epimerase/dehydratase family protein [Gemmatimonadota bacterium]
MTTLVTGATGLLGNNVVRSLLARGGSVRCLVRGTSDRRALRGLEVEEVTGDVRSADAVGRAVEGVDLVVHAAALVGVGRRRMAEYRDVNVGGTMTVARACSRRGVRLLHVSSVDTLPFGTRDDPTDESAPLATTLPVPYMVTKREAEEVVLGEVDRGLDAVVVHPGYLLGPWDWKPSSGRMLLAVARGRGLVAPCGGNDFCHVADVAEGVLAAAAVGATGSRYILSGEALTYRAAFETFARVTGAPGPLWTAPAGLLVAAGRVGDLVAAVAGVEPDLNSASARAASMPHHFSSARARDELGYESRPAETAARDAWRWFRARGYA